MPLITAQDVLEYTSFDTVLSRSEAHLVYDIVQAEQDVFKYVGHKFTDEKYVPLPAEVKLAIIKAAEYYALVNADEAFARGMKSEKIGDYSYTLGDGVEQRFSLETLLGDYVEAGGKNGLRFRMRSV